MRKKQVIRINENQLRKIVTESVKKVLKETLNEDRGIPEDSEDWEDYMTNCPRDSKIDQYLVLNIGKNMDGNT
jgi:hypothetical protein